MRRSSPVTALLITLAALACRVPAPGAADSARGGAAPADTQPPAAAPTDSAAAPVELRTDKSSYRPGDQMTLTLVSRADTGYSFNPCTRALERETAGGWTAVNEEGRVCTMEAWLLEPRGTRSGPTELPKDLEPGRYRVVLTLTAEGQQTPPATHVRITSAPFAVQP